MYCFEKYFIFCVKISVVVVIICSYVRVLWDCKFVFCFYESFVFYEKIVDIFGCFCSFFIFVFFYKCIFLYENRVNEILFVWVDKIFYFIYVFNLN